MKSIALTLFLVAAATLAGCSYFTALTHSGAEASDKALEANLWALCNATPVGAIKRKFNTPELSRLWTQLCTDHNGFTIIEPE